jgi:hypothetical protein
MIKKCSYRDKIKKSIFVGFCYGWMGGVYLTYIKRKSRRFSSFSCGSNVMERLRRDTVPSALTRMIL